MSQIPHTVKRYLFDKGIPYRLHVHRGATEATEAASAMGIAGAQLALAHTVQEDGLPVLLIYRADRGFDVAALRHMSGRNLRPADSSLAARLMPPCGAQGCVPIADLYRIDALIDQSLASAETVYIALTSQVLCEVSGEDFCRLQGVNWSALAFEAEGDDSTSRQERRERIRATLSHVEQLPTMPHVAAEVLRISGDPNAGAAELASVVERDPSISAQLIRYARSALYGYRGDIESIQQVIARVLGFDLVVDVALGISLARSMRMPKDGPLGMQAFWRHAVHCASLSQALASMVNTAERPRPGMAYLTGLVHNFGLLAMGELFEDEFNMLNRAVLDQPTVSVTELESRLIGVHHSEIGGWLLQAWNMPDEVITVAREHHNEGYRGAYAGYVRLTLLANRLLARHEVGDEGYEALPGLALSALGIAETDAWFALETIWAGTEDLDEMARQMVA